MPQVIIVLLKYQTSLSSSSEAEFPEFGPPRAAIQGTVGERGKQYCTETLSKYKTHLQNLPSSSYYPFLHQGKAWAAAENAQPSCWSCSIGHSGLFLLSPSLPALPASLIILKHKIYLLFKWCHQKQQCWLCNQCSIHWPRKWGGGKTVQNWREIREDFAAGLFFNAKFIYDTHLNQLIYL